ncbi:MAG TPA: enolase C-terminal domain-like protein [Gemmataceae bacterium]|nr:enolase C-terminal domain-like protein [Gemmataceae bacterium]
MIVHRREWLRSAVGGLAGAACAAPGLAQESRRKVPPLKITGLKVTPIALPDPPLLAASGCHGPYFLRNLVEIETDAGIMGVGETRGGRRTTDALEKARATVVGQNAFAYRAFARPLLALDPGAYAGIELACLDACGKATGRRLCELLGGPVREEVEFAAYLFYRYAADHPKLLADTRIVDQRGRGDRALDDWGEVRSPEAMVQMADRFRQRWGFRVLKLKGGVLDPEAELETMRALDRHFGGKCPLRIDPNARWRTATALRIGQKLKDVTLEYYEDPVAGQRAMAEVRQATGLRMSTNMCVTRFEHVPEAVRLQPIDVVLSDHHYWGGIPACQELGRLCETLGWGVSQHSNNHAGVTMAAMIHLGAVVPQLTYASDTHYPWLVPGADIIEGPNLPIQGGKMRVPDGPGLGVRLDADKVARAHEVYRKCGMRERDDATTMRLVEPGWERKLF